MEIQLQSAQGLWLPPLLVLTIGPALIAAAAVLACRFCRSAVWQRTHWQAATLGLVGLVALEISGLGSGLVAVCRVDGTTSLGTNNRPVGRRTEGFSAVRAADVDRWLSPSVAPLTGPLPLLAGDDDLTLRNLASAHRSLANHLQDDAAAAEFGVSDMGRARDALASRVPDPLSVGVLSVTGPACSQRFEPSPQPLPVTVHGPRGRDTAIHDDFPPLAPPPTPPHNVADLSDFVVANFFAATLRGGGYVTPSHRPQVIGSEVSLWPLWLWLFGTLVLAIRIAWAHLVTLCIGWRIAVPAETPLACQVAYLGQRLGVGRRVRVVRMPRLCAPVACGLIRPTIGLPVAFDAQFSSDQRQAILVHELAHLAARDPAWQVVGDLAAAALWWHPAAWWTRRRLRTASELAADQASLLILGGPDHLAASLVALGRQMTSPPRLGWLSIRGTGYRSNLGRRAERLLSLCGSADHPPRHGRLWVARTAVAATLILLVVFATAWVRPQAALAEGESEMHVLKQSWNHSLAAAAALALLTPATTPATADDGPVQVVAAVADQAGSDDLLAVVLDDDEDRDEDAEQREAEERERAEEREEAEDREEEEREEAEEEREGEEREAQEREEEEREEAHERGRGEDREAEEREAQEREEIEREEAHERDEHLEREHVEHDEARERELGAQREKHERMIDRFRGEHEQLVDRAERIRHELEELGDRNPAGRRELEQALRETEAKVRDIERRVHGFERDRARQQVQEMKRKVHELAEADRHEEAEQVEQEVRRLTREIERDGRHEQMMERFQDQHAELEKRGHQIQARMAELGDSRPDARHELAQALHQIERQAHQLERRAHGFEREAAEERLAEMKADLERLARAGHHEEAHQVEEELHRMTRELQRDALQQQELERDAQQQERRRSPERDDVERRLEHLRIAVDNLHAAGLHDQAEELARAAERLVHPDRGPDDRRGGPERQHGPALEQAVDLLHDQMAEMRDQIRGLQEQLERLSERRRR
jgi:beta-lactamase regulating signal transducer with metallopeptidase domain